MANVSGHGQVVIIVGRESGHVTRVAMEASERGVRIGQMSVAFDRVGVRRLVDDLCRCAGLRHTWNGGAS